MGTLGSCDLVDFDDFVDLGDPTAVNTTGWITTTYDAYVVEVDIGATNGVFLPADEEGSWSTLADLHGYLSDLTGVPTDPSGHLMPFVVEQNGAAAVYFADNDVLLEGANFFQIITSGADGLIRVNNTPINSMFEDDCVLPNPTTQDLCEWQGGACNRTVSGQDGDTSAESAHEMRMWQRTVIYRNQPVPILTGCASHQIRKLRVNGSLVIPSGATMSDVSDTNPLVNCTLVNGQPSCDLRSLAEIVPPAGFTPGQSGYYNNLKVRATRVVADMTMESDFYSNQTLRDTHDIIVTDAWALQLDWSANGLPMNASCSYNRVNNGADEIELENGIHDDGASNPPGCVPDP